jgi:predicted secreted Zn-dependent protease
MILKGDDYPVVSSPLHWRRSTKCASETCVEVAISGNRAYVRSSKDAAGAYLVFDAEEWRSFVSGVRDHEFDID